MEKAAAHPYGVAAHWFQYNDQFCLGRFDGENYQIGMMDVCMQPYPELMEAAYQTSKVLDVYKRQDVLISSIRSMAWIHPANKAGE